MLFDLDLQDIVVRAQAIATLAADYQQANSRFTEGLDHDWIVSEQVRVLSIHHADLGEALRRLDTPVRAAPEAYPEPSESDERPPSTKGNP